MEIVAFDDVQRPAVVQAHFGCDSPDHDGDFDGDAIHCRASAADGPARAITGDDFDVEISALRTAVQQLVIRHARVKCIEAEVLQLAAKVVLNDIRHAALRAVIEAL